MRVQQWLPWGRIHMRGQQKNSFCHLESEIDLFFSAAILAQLDCEISQCGLVPESSEDNAMVLIDIKKNELREETSEMIDDEDWEVEGYESIKERYDKDFSDDYPKQFASGCNIYWN